MNDMLGIEIEEGDILIEPNKSNLSGTRLHVAYGGHTQLFIRTMIINHFPSENADYRLSIQKMKSDTSIIITEEQAESFINHAIETGRHRHDNAMHQRVRNNYEFLLEFAQAIKEGCNLDNFLIQSRLK